MTGVVCVKCEVAMRYRGPSITTEMADFGPYKVWSVDTFECPSCAAVVLTRFGQSRISEHYEDSFVGWLKQSTTRWWNNLKDKQKGGHGSDA